MRVWRCVLHVFRPWACVSYAAASVELQLEKNSEEIIARLRDMRAQIDRKTNELDRKFDQKMESLHNAIDEKILRNIAGFEARVMSQIEHVHAVDICLSSEVMLRAVHIVWFVTCYW